MTHPRIFLSPPHMGGHEEAYVKEAFDSNFIAPVGSMIDRFEANFSRMTGIPYCLATSSGTAAIHLALRVMGVGAGDIVYASSLTFLGSVSPVLYQGATPVFFDSAETTWTLDVALVREALQKASAEGRLPKALIPTDLYGQSCDAGPLRELCDEFDVKLIIDAAEAVGTTYGGKHAGFLGDAAAFSFNGNKIITTSGGGMLASHNKEFIDNARFLSHQARDPAPHYEHHTYGYNYRMSNIVAAIGVGQLEVLEARVARRREIFNCYRTGLADLHGIGFMPEAAYGTGNRWLSCITVNSDVFGATPEAIRLALEAENIESRPLWKPMHMQPLFRTAEMHGGTVSERLFATGLCLPSGTQMTEADLERVIHVIRAIAKR